MTIAMQSNNDVPDTFVGSLASVQMPTMITKFTHLILHNFVVTTPQIHLTITMFYLVVAACARKDRNVRKRYRESKPSVDDYTASPTLA